MVSAILLVSKPHLKRGLSLNSWYSVVIRQHGEEQKVYSSLLKPSRQNRWLLSHIQLLPSWTKVRHLVHHEGPGIQILLLCGFHGWNLHTLRVSATGVVWEISLSTTCLDLGQTSWLSATAWGRPDMEEGEVCSFQPETSSSCRCAIWGLKRWSKLIWN